MKNSKILNKATKTAMSLMMCLSMASVANPFLVHAEEPNENEPVQNVNNTLENEDANGKENNSDEKKEQENEKKNDENENLNGDDKKEEDNKDKDPKPIANEAGLYKAEAKEPTCEEDGNVEYWYDDNGKFFSDEKGEHEIELKDTVVKKLGHDFGDWVIVIPATHEEKGVQKRVCSRDESHIETSDIEAIQNHIWGEWIVVKEATAKKEGRQERECEICGAKESVVIPKIGHICELEAVEGIDPKCEEAGLYAHYVCKEDANHIYWDELGEDPAPAEELIIPALGHEWTDWKVTKEAKCEEYGEKERICRRCQEKEVEAIMPLGHEWSDWKVIKEPTCSELGEKTRTCARCNKLDKQEIAKLDHTWGDWEVVREATCTNKGLKRRICKVCDEVETKETSKLGHKWGDWTINKKPTCTQNGSKTHVCSRCNEKETVEIDATGHDWNEWQVVKAATETANGEAKRTCKNDSSHVETRVIPATGKTVVVNTGDPSVLGNVMVFSSSTIMAIASAIFLKRH